MKLKTDETGTIKLGWKDTIKCKVRNNIPYKLNRVIGYEDTTKTVEAGEIQGIFNTYLISNRCVPNTSSGQKVVTPNADYYYIECHKPFLPVSLLNRFFPLTSWDRQNIGRFVDGLGEKFNA